MSVALPLLKRHYQLFAQALELPVQPGSDLRLLVSFTLKASPHRDLGNEVGGDSPS